ncbi:1-acyl-sn-glycerol-3-phosphate acyltransferase [Sphingomonas gellani]|uniref:1-acyl-sn-glycerol-3-phosphate acyltransferase n=1 Tax=Sphingomonas gellani TaxID=1166340 RepID=A0A1H8CH58_9SPHN|nr:lysophospholipid acyltransferase family protein [Sphingomonas gellani]SEM94423.1 1-acyl-sn-glycerol-3-phosphate acyltransferase [Sphingomonas gellani]
MSGTESGDTTGRGQDDATVADWCRTVLFTVVFYGLSVPVVAIAPASALFGQRSAIAYAHGWARLHRWATRAILGIHVRVEGQVPPTQTLFAAKHQAMFETLELQLLLGGPAMVLKRQLMRIPLWGWAARLYGAIAVDREASAKALRGMVREAEAAKATGRSVIVYPEGTRVAPGQTPPLRSGFAGLYRALSLPTVPIALDTGRLLPRHGARRPGVVTIRLGEPIPPGLPRREIEARVHAEINALEPSRA